MGSDRTALRDAATATSNLLKWQPVAGFIAIPFFAVTEDAHSSSKNASVSRLRGCGRVVAGGMAQGSCCEVMKNGAGAG